MNRAAFYLLTDTHLVAKALWEEGEPITMRERGDQIALKLSPEILDSYLEKIIADQETDTVVFTGDNVNGGDLISHEAFRARLERLRSANKKVYVICATHDYCGMGDDENFFTASRYTATGTEPTDCMRKGMMFDYYAEYGPKQAISVHRESGSYTVRLEEGVRLILIDDNGNGRSHCGLFEDGFAWLKDQIREAKAAGDYVLLATHHPVLAPFEAYRHMFDFELFGGYKDLCKLMCEEGVRVVFTGHTHVQSIRKYTDETGNWFVNVATTAAVNAAGRIRHVTVDPQTGVCDIKSVTLDSISGVDTGGLSAFEYLYRLNLPGRLEYLLPLAKQDYAAFLKEAQGCLPVDKLQKHRFLVRFAIGLALKLRLSFAAKLGKTWKTMPPAQKKEAKSKKLASVLLEVFRHIFCGNGPFAPGTTEYAALHGLVVRIDRIVQKRRIEKVEKLIPPGSSLSEMADDFLYNNRTGDDDAICINL